MRQTLTSMQWVIWSTKAALHSQLIIVYQTHTHIRIISSSTFEQCNWKPIQVYCFKHLLQHRQQHNTHRAVQLSHLHSKPYRISQKANFPYCHQSHSNTDNVNELFVIGNAGFMWMREQLNTICMRWISQPASPTSGNDKLVSQLCVCVWFAIFVRVCHQLKSFWSFDFWRLCSKHIQRFTIFLQEDKHVCLTAMVECVWYALADW